MPQVKERLNWEKRHSLMRYVWSTHRSDRFEVLKAWPGIHDARNSLLQPDLLNKVGALILFSPWNYRNSLRSALSVRFCLLMPIFLREGTADFVQSGSLLVFLVQKETGSLAHLLSMSQTTHRGIISKNAQPVTATARA